MKCNLPLLLACSSLLLPASGLAQILDARPIGATTPRTPGTPAAAARPAAPKPWPSVRAPLGQRIFTRQDDDRGPQTFTQLRFPAVTVALDNGNLSDWRKVAAPARYASEWTSRWTPDLLFGLAELPATSFPAPLDAAVWQGYLSSLRQQHGARLRLLSDDDSELNMQMLRPLLGGRTRVLDYEILPEKPEDPVRRVVQVFMIAPGGVFVAGCEGPAPVVQQFQQTFASLLMRMEAEATAPVSASDISANRPAAATPVRGG